MIHELLTGYKVVLASVSPRRKELFSLLGLKATIIPADIAEPLSEERPEFQAMKHAQNKALFVKSKLTMDSLVVAADTLVAVNERVLGKPNDVCEARLYLRELSGCLHEVFTGICICFQDKVMCDFERTRVYFAKLTDAEIDEYIATGEPMDKAGAYGIQGYGAQFVQAVDGCYFNVMGFPIHRFYMMLQRLMLEVDT